INLISNSVKYGKSTAPEVRIFVENQGDTVVLNVRDNGPGIATENHARAFEKFARLDEVTLAGSAGLGLPISREIMRNIGGDLELVPSDLGAHFRLTLRPANASASQETEAISGSYGVSGKP
ncbi:MAG: sensor histidine kinase, partial [Pseudomonadota bacterium]